MPTESENLARSTKAMQLIEQYFPHTANIIGVVDVCKSLGIDNHTIQNLLYKGEAYSYGRSIINPADGGKHDILEVELKLGPEEEVLLDGKDIAAYFAELMEKEKTLIMAANKKGEAAEIYRENLRLKKRLADVTLERDQFREIAEAVVGKGK